VTREQNRGECASCGRSFDYYLVHNGFNASHYAYCDRCGRTLFLDIYYDRIPEESGFPAEGLSPHVQALLAPCECGGRFAPTARPRCPHCQAELSAEGARSYLEANASGTAQGWRWQGNWAGIYCIVIEDRTAEDAWQPSA